MFNKVFLIGNLGRDPEVRETNGGMPVANFSLATNRRWNDKDGNRQEKTEWHDVVCFGRLAEIAGQYLAQGRQVHVEGRIQTRSWDDRETGEKRYRTEVVCENFQILGKRPADPEPDVAPEEPDGEADPPPADAKAEAS